MKEDKKTKKMLPVILVIAGVVVVGVGILLAVLLGGGGDVLKGRWEGTTNDAMSVVWDFDGKGKFKLTSIILDEAPGTYTMIDEDTVRVDLEAWSAAKVYDFRIDDDKLMLDATDALSPDYELVRK